MIVDGVLERYILGSYSARKLGLATTGNAGGLHNLLVDQGVEVITEEDHFVHVSGHPCRDELAQMYRWIRPRLALPVPLTDWPAAARTPTWR